MAPTKGLEPLIPYGTAVFKTARLPIITSPRKMVGTLSNALSQSSSTVLQTASRL